MLERKKMIRILHVFGKLNLGGAESRIMDLYRHIDRNCVQFDFVVHTNEECFFEEEIASMGGRVFRVPRFKIYNLISYKKAWKKLLSEHKDEFKMIQGHMTSTASIYLPIAKKEGIKTTISHVRSAGVDPGIKGFVTRLLRRNLANKADYLFACSEDAAISAYGLKAVNANKTTFIPNAIDTSLFRFDSERRLNTRKELLAEDKIIVGHVGRFHYAKNHEYVLRVFEAFRRMLRETKQKDAILILLGDGPNKDELVELAKTLKIDDAVKFLGNHKDVYRYYDAMDIFLYPSRYEGLPGTVIEAQASGLRCVISDTICKEVFISELVHKLNINDEPEIWAKKMIDMTEMSYNRKEYADIVLEAGFDVNAQAKKMMLFYENGSF